MADIKISELGAASAVNNTDLFPMTSSGVTVKATAQQIKNYMGVGNIADLNTTDKSSAVAAINEVNTKVSKTEVLISNSGDAYSPSKPYKVGELCIYNNVLYRCTTACSAGSWATNQSCFAQDTLARVASNLNSNLTDTFIIQTFTNSSAVFSSGVWGLDITVNVPSGYTVIGTVSITMSRLQGLSLTISEYLNNPSRYHMGGYNDGANTSGVISITLAMVKTSLM